MTYGEECWLIKKQHMHNMYAIEMRMCGKTRKDRIRHERFQDQFGVSIKWRSIKIDKFEVVGRQGDFKEKFLYAG